MNRPAQAIGVPYYSLKAADEGMAGGRDRFSKLLDAAPPGRRTGALYAVGEQAGLRVGTTLSLRAGLSS